MQIAWVHSFIDFRYLLGLRYKPTGDSNYALVIFLPCIDWKGKFPNEITDVCIVFQKVIQNNFLFLYFYLINIYFLLHWKAYIAVTDNNRLINMPHWVEIYFEGAFLFDEPLFSWDIYWRASKIRTVLHNFDWLIFHYFLQLIFRLTPLTSAEYSNQKFINQKLCNTQWQSLLHTASCVHQSSCHVRIALHLALH